MSLVVLVSGGLDSTLLALLTREEEIAQFPLFVNYGQLCAAQEWKTCQGTFSRLSLPEPRYLDVSGFGHLISSGLTDQAKSINEDAFLPGRNLLFLLYGASYAYQTNSSGVAIGLLSEEASIFPDQKRSFLLSAEGAIESALGRKIRVVAPLIGFTKRQVIELAKARHLTGTYSCHAGGALPCGRCVSCVEFQNAEKEWRS
jgi:7-cyano-7-deazaguanine synthase